MKRGASPSCQRPSDRGKSESLQKDGTKVCRIRYISSYSEELHPRQTRARHERALAVRGPADLEAPRGGGCPTRQPRVSAPLEAQSAA
jgi:hypothetical protein